MGASLSCSVFQTTAASATSQGLFWYESATIQAAAKSAALRMVWLHWKGTLEPGATMGTHTRSKNNPI
jgi:hypothetical protein